MSGRFVLKRGRTGKFRFNLLSANGKVVASSEAYETKSAALNGIESVRKNAPDARLDDQTPSATQETGQGRQGSKVGRALKRDWEQTKSDMPGLEGKDLDQDLTDTVRQASDEQSIPAADRSN